MRAQGQMIRILFIVLFSVLFFVNCGQGVQIHGNTGSTGGQNDGGDAGSGDVEGSDGGDAGSGDGTGADPIPDFQQATFSDFKNYICDAIADCYDVPDNVDCSIAVESDDNLLASFGVSVLFYQSFSEVDEAIDEGQAELSPEASNCATAIQNVSCAQMDSVNAYRESQPANFSNIYQIVPHAECGDLID